MRIFATLAFLTVLPNASFAESTFLAEQTIPLNSSRSNEVLDKTMADVRMVFQKFELALDSSSKIVVPKRISGTAARPVMTVSVRKCVAFICQTMDLDAEVDVREVSGRCNRDFVLTAKLGRSSREVREVYDALTVNVCFREGRSGKGSLRMLGYARHAREYQQGIVQQELVKMLRMQVSPLSRALQATLKAKEQR